MRYQRSVLRHRVLPSSLRPHQYTAESHERYPTKIQWFMTWLRASVLSLLGLNGPSAHTVAKAQPLSKLTTMLGNQVGRPVLDKTGLTGKYDFSIEFTPNLPPGLPGPGTAVAAQVDNTSEPGPNLADAVQRQLGLRLVASKAKLDVVVIDKAEKVPTAN